MQLIDYRKSLDMSRAEMARQLGVDIVTAWRWEAGYMTPRPKQMQEIAAWSKGAVLPNDWISTPASEEGAK